MWSRSGEAPKFPQGANVALAVVFGLHPDWRDEQIILDVEEWTQRRFNRLLAHQHLAVLRQSAAVLAANEAAWAAERRADQIAAEKWAQAQATRQLNMAHEMPAPSAPAGVAVLAREFRRLVDAHFRENWPIERYETELGTTPHLLAKACRDAFGVSPKEFIGQRRMLEAKRLLLFTVRPVEDIAYELGLKDAAYFSRFFKQRAGEPPGLWRLRTQGR